MVKYREEFMLRVVAFLRRSLGCRRRVPRSRPGDNADAKACEIADRVELDIFVEAHEFAESFYQKIWIQD